MKGNTSGDEKVNSPQNKANALSSALLSPLRRMGILESGGGVWIDPDPDDGEDSEEEEYSLEMRGLKDAAKNCLKLRQLVGERLH